MKNLTNKIALITGSAAGIGKAIAEKLAESGATIVIADLNLAGAEATAAEIAQQYKVPTFAVKIDVSNQTDVNAGIEAVLAKFKKIDILVSNAGIQVISSILDFRFEDWRKIMAVHLDGAFLMTQACMRAMAKAKSGRIIFIGSVHSYEASLKKSAYVAAKHGLMGLMRAVAKEGAEYGISANLVAPGFVKTALVEKQIPEQAKELGITEEQVIKDIMLGETIDGEFTTAAEVADVVDFLAQRDSLSLSGQSIIVSHGWHLQ